MNTLAGKTALVTGASSGIGYATATLLAQLGARVVVGARRQHALDELVSRIAASGGTAVALAGDVRDEEYAKALVTHAASRFGGLDMAFNNAGTLGEMGSVHEVSLAGWEETVATNLTAAFLAAKHQVPLMLQRGAGSIVFTSTFVGYTVGFPGTSAYAASKAGLIGLTQSLAAELGSAGIRVNAMLPGATDTPMARAMNPGVEQWAFVESLHALKRASSPEEQARAALFLLSDASSFVTGTAMLVDGGVSITRV